MGKLKFMLKTYFFTLELFKILNSYVIESIDPDCCDVVIQGKGGKIGGFRGEKLTLTEFKEKYKGFSFEVIDEYYGWHKLQFVGWLWMPNTYPKDMTLSIRYFKGDVVYRTEEIQE